MSVQQVPDQMSAIVLDSSSGVEALRVEQRPVPETGRNEVLVKIAATPINPSDLTFLGGLCGIPKQRRSCPDLRVPGRLSGPMAA